MNIEVSGVPKNQTGILKVQRGTEKDAHLQTLIFFIDHSNRSQHNLHIFFYKNWSDAPFIYHIFGHWFYGFPESNGYLLCFGGGGVCISNLQLFIDEDAHNSVIFKLIVKFVRWYLCSMEDSHLNLVLHWLLFCLFYSSIVINTVTVTAGTFET